jgi:hypothetical protein
MTPISKKSKSLFFIFHLLILYLPLHFEAGKKQETITCSFDNGQEPYDSGDLFMFCINYIPLMIKENSYLRVGKTTVIHQKFMWRIFEKIGTDIILQVANSTVYSRALPFNRPHSNMAFPFIPIVITLDYGKVIDLSIQSINDVCSNEEVQSGILKNFYKSSKTIINLRSIGSSE